MPPFNTEKAGKAAPPAMRRVPLGLLSISAVAEQLDVSDKTVRRMISAGELPAHRVGRLLRVSQDDLLLFLAQRRS